MTRERLKMAIGWNTVRAAVPAEALPRAGAAPDNESHARHRATPVSYRYINIWYTRHSLISRVVALSQMCALARTVLQRPAALQCLLIAAPGPSLEPMLVTSLSRG
jgi:hypothetical protein